MFGFVLMRAYEFTNILTREPRSRSKPIIMDVECAYPTARTLQTSIRSQEQLLYRLK